MRKSLRVQVRVDEKLRARLDNAEKVAKIKESSFFVELLEAYCEYVESNDEISFPLTVIPKKKLEILNEQLELALANNPSPILQKGRGKSRMLGKMTRKAIGG